MTLNTGNVGISRKVFGGPGRKRPGLLPSGNPVSKFADGTEKVPPLQPYPFPVELDYLGRVIRKWPKKGDAFDPGLIPMGRGINGRHYDPRLSREDLPLMAARGTDTVPAMLTPGEAVLTPPAAEAIGRGNIRALNEASNKGLLNSKPIHKQAAPHMMAGGGQSGRAQSPPAGRKRRNEPFMPQMLQHGTEELHPIGYVSPEMVDPVWQDVQLKGGLSLDELQRLKQATQKKGSNAQDVSSVLSVLNQSGIFNRGTPYYGAGSNVSQALGPAMEQAWAGYQGGTEWVDPPELNLPEGGPPSTTASGGYPSNVPPYDLGMYPTPIANNPPPGMDVGSNVPWGPESGPGWKVRAFMANRGGLGPQSGGDPRGGGEGGFPGPFGVPGGGGPNVNPQTGGIGGQGGSFFGGRSNPAMWLPGSTFNLGASGGHLGSMGGLLFAHKAQPMFGGLNILQAQRRGLLPNPNFNLSRAYDVGGRVIPSQV